MPVLVMVVAVGREGDRHRALGEGWRLGLVEVVGFSWCREIG